MLFFNINVMALQKTYSDIEYIFGIKSDNKEVLQALYYQYFKMVRHIAITNRGNEESAKDLFHETLMVLVHVVKKEEFQLTSSLSTFIYSIAKRLWLKELKKNSKTSLHDSFDNTSNLSDTTNYDELLEVHTEKEKNIKKMHIALQQLGTSCFELLKHFYFTKLSMEKIAEELGYNNADVAKNQKYKCLQRLKKQFFKDQQVLTLNTDYESDND